MLLLQPLGEGGWRGMMGRPTTLVILARADRVWVGQKLRITRVDMNILDPDMLSTIRQEVEPPLMCGMSFCGRRATSQCMRGCHTVLCDSVAICQAWHAPPSWWCQPAHGGCTPLAVCRLDRSKVCTPDASLFWTNDTCSEISDDKPTADLSHAVPRWIWLGNRGGSDLRKLWSGLANGYPLQAGGSPITISHMLYRMWAVQINESHDLPLPVGTAFVCRETLRLLGQHPLVRTVSKTQFLSFVKPFSCFQGPGTPYAVALRQQIVLDAFHFEWLHDLVHEVALLLVLQKVFGDRLTREITMQRLDLLDMISMAGAEPVERRRTVHECFSGWPPGLVPLLLTWDTCTSVPLAL